MASLLLVEDEKNVGSTLTERLMRDGFEVHWSLTLRDGKEAIDQNEYEGAILDVGLPDGSGFELAQTLREKSRKTAVIFLTAYGTPEDRIRGLELGAEDYLVKPFHYRELLLRIQNGLKRVRFPNAPSLAQVGKAKIDFDSFEAEVENRKIPLTHKECALLHLLVSRRGKVTSRDEILDTVWGKHEFPTPRTVDNFILRIRKLIETNPETPKVVKSIRGVGYQLL